MTLNHQEESLLDAFRRLSPQAAEGVSALTLRLATLGTKSTIDWSDSWSEEDLRDYASAALQVLDDREADAESR